MECQSHCFNIPKNVSYLNCAYMGPLSHQVMAVGQQAITQKGQPYNITVEDFFQPVTDLKSAFAELINAAEPQRICIMPSASYGLSTVARNLPVSKGENIITLKEQFPSNIYCWRRLCREQGLELRTIAAPDVKENRGDQWNLRILEAIDEKTAAVTIGTLHWADGTRFDLEAIRARTREVGAMLIIDGTQSVGALPFDVNHINPDALICAAYKWLLGPYALALAYFGNAFDGGVPIEENWINRVGSDNFQAQVNYEDEYHPYATRYDMGEKSNFFLVPMLIESLKQIKAWGVAEIQAYCEMIAAPVLEKLITKGFFIEQGDYRANHLFGIRFPDHFDAVAFKRSLTESQVHISFRGDAIRVSPHIYNSPKDMDNLYACLISGIPK